MHNEENKLGLTVTNKKKLEYKIVGDKQLYAPENSTNRELMRQALQTSVNEVWDAYKTKTAKRPTDGGGYSAWDYAPYKSVDSKNHSPLFKEYKLSWAEQNLLGHWPILVRSPFKDPKSTEYTPIGGSAALIKLYNEISESKQWKNY